MKKVCNVLVCLVIFVIGYFCFFKYILKTDYVGLGNYKLLTVSSESMRPNIKPGDAVIIKTISDLNKGDIVYYGSSGIQNLREIISVSNGKAIVRENYMGNEEEIEIYKIMGVVVKKIPNLGHILFQLTQPWTFFLACLLIGSYFAFVYGSKHS